MRNSILEQAVKLLREKRKYRYWLTAFLCLAVLVTLGTVTVLKMNGQAMSHKEKTLDCQLEIHQHTDECYDEEHNLICGQADYVVHTHNEEDCYDENGELVCKLPEIKAHTHSPECYQEKEELVCKLEEQEEHHHTDECYTLERGDLICGQEGIFPEGEGTPAEGNTPIDENTPATEETPAEEDIPTEQIIQTEESAPTLENSPADEVLPTVEGLPEEEIVTEDGSIPEEPETGNTGGEIVEEIAGMDANAGTYEGHVHTDTCYEWKEVPACGKEETDGHTHTDECYETKNELVCGQDEVSLHTHDESCYDEEGRLTCGLLEVKEHIHGPECFKTTELTAEEVVSLNTAGSEKEPEKAEDEKIVKTYKDDSINVTAEYTELANIPDEAELIVKQITAESDPEHYAEREAEFKKEMGGDDANMNFLLDIGFYVDGEEVEPLDTVTVKVKFTDDKAFEKDEPVKMLHFAEDGTEVLEGENGEEGVLIFKMDSFSEAILFADTVAGGTGSSRDILGVGNTTKIPTFKVYVLYSDKSWVEAGEITNRSYIKKDTTNKRWCIDVKAFSDILGKYGYSADQIITEGDQISRWIGHNIPTDYNNNNNTKIWYNHTPMLCSDGEGIYWETAGTGHTSGEIGLYYLPGNTQSSSCAKNEVDDKYVAATRIVFNPANNNGTSEKSSDYGLKAKELRTTIVIPVKGNADTVTINLPNNDQLGQEFLIDSKGTKGVVPGLGDYGFRRKLVGWYNIADGEYYSVGSIDTVTDRTATIDPKKSNVFYADWVAASYDNPEVEGVTTKPAADTDFVTTRMFDYNELFNLYSASLERNGIQSEKWTDSGTFFSNPAGSSLDHVSREGSFLFMMTEGDKRKDQLSSIRPLNQNNKNPGNKNPGKETSGILSRIQSNGMKDWLDEYLFNYTGTKLGVHYLGTGTGLFQRDTDGYYYFDSETDAATYDRSSGQFHIYEDPQQFLFYDQNENGFFPLNQYTQDGYAKYKHNSYTDNDVIGKTENGMLNFFFGMSSEIQFYLAATPGNGGNQVNNKPMKFEFSGDDDMWVFIDDQLILDIGGIHAAVNGEIDFTTGKVTVNGVEDSEKSAALRSIRGGKSYTMTVYYMERGAGDSNCKIRFNTTPRYVWEKPTAAALSVEKKWEIAGTEEEQEKLKQPVTVHISSVSGNAVENFATVTLNKSGDPSENWKHTWTECEPSIPTYRAVEDPIDNFQAKTVYNVTEKSLWSELDFKKSLSDLAGKEIIILDPDCTKALAKDLTIKDVERTQGKYFLDDQTSVPDDIRWTIEMPSNDSSKYYLKNIDGEYLCFSGGSLSRANSSSEATLFQKDTEFVTGFVVTEDQTISWSGDSFVVVSKTTGIQARTYMAQEHEFFKETAITITNKYLPTVQIAKIDSESGEYLAGAAFKLVRQMTEGNTVSYAGYYGKEWHNLNANSLDEALNALTDNQVCTVNDNGMLKLDQMENAEYRLREITAPTGYKGSDASISFTIAGNKIICTDTTNVQLDSVNQILKIKNTAKKSPQISFKKISNPSATNQNGKPLAGARFDLYKVVLAGSEGADNVSGIKDTVKKIAADQTSSDDGFFYTNTLAYGTYYLVETQAPDGYNRLDGPIKFSINEGGSITIIEEGSENKATISSNSTGIEISIPNKSGYELPHTGSSGTQPFTIGGAILLLAGAFLLYGHSTRQRQRAKRSGR